MDATRSKAELMLEDALLRQLLNVGLVGEVVSHHYLDRDRGAHVYPIHGLDDVLLFALRIGGHAVVE